MLLLLMRHGIAAPLCDAIPADFQRPLTAKGRNRTRLAARGLWHLAPQIEVLASSPKTRARQTAQIVRKSGGKSAPKLTEWSELVGDDFAAITSKLRALENQTVLLCGHEPHLSRLTSQLLTGNAETLPIEWKKAGVCALKLDWETDSAILLWHLTPKQLRKIKNSK